MIGVIICPRCHAEIGGGNETFLGGAAAGGPDVPMNAGGGDMVERLMPTVTEVKATAYCGPHPDGEYVRFSDYAALKAENERLREGLELIAQDKHRLMNGCARQTAASILEGKPI